ncbi:MAG: fimbrillin family protein [Bacteroidaceae bacterium]|nr:fimbrillin family protein [Bacteroidaceae bacterium]
MKTKLSILLTAGLLAACSSDNETQPEAPVRHIRVVVNERPMISNEAKVRGAETRAEITTTSTLNGFTMKGIFDGVHTYTVEKKSTWSIKPGSWIQDVPNNTEVPFYAYTANGTYNDFYPNDGEGNPYINFEVSEDAFNQHDLLVAKTSASYSGHDGEVGTVSLTFDHACAAVEFNVGVSEKVKNKLGNNTLTVNSIVLKNVNNSGKYYFDKGWKDVNGSSNYTLTNGNIDITTEYKPLPCNHLFLIPQLHTADGTTGTYLEISYEFTGQTRTSATIPLNINWEEGTKYTINILLGTSLIK